MKNEVFNYIFPVVGGSLGATSPIYIGTLSWHAVGDSALTAAIFALVGGVIGWGVKFALDTLVKKK